MLVERKHTLVGVLDLFAAVAVVSISLNTGGCARRDAIPATSPGKRTIGATARITEKEAGVVIPARVDTGAHTCSIDAEQIVIEDQANDKRQNVGKRIRFLMRDGNVESDWIESTITGQATERTADGRESTRYEVRLTLQHGDFEKEVLVTLNDRSKLEYPMLLGRNFLRDDFVVDVSIDRDD